MALLELVPIAFGGTPGIVRFLQNKRETVHVCGRGAIMALRDRADVSDGCR